MTSPHNSAHNWLLIITQTRTITAAAVTHLAVGRASARLTWVRGGLVLDVAWKNLVPPSLLASFLYSLCSATWWSRAADILRAVHWSRQTGAVAQTEKNNKKWKNKEKESMYTHTSIYNIISKRPAAAANNVYSITRNCPWAILYAADCLTTFFFLPGCLLLCQMTCVLYIGLFNCMVCRLGAFPYYYISSLHSCRPYYIETAASCRPLSLIYIINSCVDLSFIWELLLGLYVCAGCCERRF